MMDVLQKLEDRVINLVDEVETLRTKLTMMIQENHAIKAENDTLRGRSETEQEKLRGILNLLDGVEEEAAFAAVAETEDYPEAVSA